MMKDVIVELLIMAFFLLIGCLLFNGRGGCFIPIYNALSEKEQNVGFDRIILFKEGRIVGQGTFEELLHTDSYFMDLYNANVK